MNAYVTKPIDRAALADTLRAIHRARRAAASRAPELAPARRRTSVPGAPPAPAALEGIDVAARSVGSGCRSRRCAACCAGLPTAARATVADAGAALQQGDAGALARPCARAGGRRRQPGRRRELREAAKALELAARPRRRRSRRSRSPTSSASRGRRVRVHSHAGERGRPRRRDRHGERSHDGSGGAAGRARQARAALADGDPVAADAALETLAGCRPARRLARRPGAHASTGGVVRIRGGSRPGRPGLQRLEGSDS